MLVFMTVMVGGTIPELGVNLAAELWKGLPGGSIAGQVLWTGVLVLVLMVCIVAWGRSFDKKSKVFQASHDVSVGHRRGAIVLVGLRSHEPGSALRKLLTHAGSLEYLALIGTPQTAEAQILKAVVEDIESIPISHIRIWEHGHAEDMEDFEACTTEAINWLRSKGLEKHEIVVDVTAGRRAMGFGAIIAATQSGIEAHELRFGWDTMANMPLNDEGTFTVVKKHYGQTLTGEVLNPS